MGGCNYTFGSCDSSGKQELFGAFNATWENPPQSSPVASSLSPVWIQVSANVRSMQTEEKREAKDSFTHALSWRLGRPLLFNAIPRGWSEGKKGFPCRKLNEGDGRRETKRRKDRAGEDSRRERGKRRVGVAGVGGRREIYTEHGGLSPSEGCTGGMLLMLNLPYVF